MSNGGPVNPPANVFGYDVKRAVGEGIGGTVYLGRDKRGRQVAIKFAPMGDYMASAEVDVYRSLKAHNKDELIGFPRLHWYGHIEGRSVMIMDYLETNISRMHRAPRSITHLLEVGRQVLSRLRTLHKVNYIHSDIKPENIMLSKNTVYLIDFGLSKMYVDPTTNRHVSASKDGVEDFSGSPNFASINAHRGIGLSRRDDLESLAYVLVYLFKGTLPWNRRGFNPSKENLDDVASQKSSINPSIVCKGLPPVAEKLLSYAKTLRFEEEPNYEMVDSWFTDDLVRFPHAKARERKSYARL